MHLSRRELVAIAKEKHVIVRNHSKDNIIRAIQRAEGNDACFGTDKVGQCKQRDCLWREDCLVANLNLGYNLQKRDKTKNEYSKHDLWALI